MEITSFKSKLRKHIETLGEIISYLQKNSNDGFLVSKLREVQGFLSYLEKEVKRLDTKES